MVDVKNDTKDVKTDIVEMISASVIQSLDNMEEVFKHVLVDNPNPIASFAGTMARLRVMEISLILGARDAWKGKAKLKDLVELRDSTDESTVLFQIFSNKITTDEAQEMFKHVKVDKLIKSAQLMAKKLETKDGYAPQLEKLDEILRRLGK